MRFRHTPRARIKDQQGRKDSNPVCEIWRLAALPGAHPFLCGDVGLLPLPVEDERR